MPHLRVGLFLFVHTVQIMAKPIHAVTRVSGKSSMIRIVKRFMLPAFSEYGAWRRDGFCRQIKKMCDIILS